MTTAGIDSALHGLPSGRNFVRLDLDPSLRGYGRSAATFSANCVTRGGSAATGGGLFTSGTLGGAAASFAVG